MDEEQDHLCYDHSHNYSVLVDGKNHEKFSTSFLWTEWLTSLKGEEKIEPEEEEKKEEVTKKKTKKKPKKRPLKNSNEEGDDDEEDDDDEEEEDEAGEEVELQFKKPPSADPESSRRSRLENFTIDDGELDVMMSKYSLVPVVEPTPLDNFGTDFLEYARISRLYKKAFLTLKTTLKDTFVEFLYPRKAPSIIRCREGIEMIQDAIKTGDDADKWAKVEFEAFRSRARQSRLDLAQEVSDAMQQISLAQADYKQQYEDASAMFEASRSVSTLFESATGSQITSDARMDKIKARADIDLMTRGEALQSLQAKEAENALRLKEEEEIVVQAIRKWRPRQFRMANECRVFQRRLSSIMIDTAARRIQKNVRIFLLMPAAANLYFYIYDEWEANCERKMAKAQEIKEHKERIKEEYRRIASIRRPISEVLKLPKLKGRAFLPPPVERKRAGASSNKEKNSRAGGGLDSLTGNLMDKVHHG